jgi:nucleotide-binding universal stress UspA family protein
MSINAIVSYDDTANDHDALVLGRLLADAGTQLTLAYVRHTTQVEHTREELDQHDAEALLERGARWLDDADVTRRVVVSASTPEGLRWLAEQEDAQIVVFGSDYRTASGHVAPGRSAQTLLEGGPAALAIAPANYRGATRQIGTIGVLAGAGDSTALETARQLADAFGSTLTNSDRNVDLLVVGSRAEAPEGRVLVTAQAQNAIENATAPVLVLARGVALQFRVPAAV